MKKKIVGILTCMLLLLPVLSSTGVSNPDDDLYVKIYAGWFRLNIGFWVNFLLRNNRDENLTVYINLTEDFLFLNFLDKNYSSNFTMRGKGIDFFGYRNPPRLSHFTITVEGGNTKVTREGFQIHRLFIFIK